MPPNPVTPNQLALFHEHLYDSRGPVASLKEQYAAGACIVLHSPLQTVDQVAPQKFGPFLQILHVVVDPPRYIRPALTLLEHTGKHKSVSKRGGPESQSSSAIPLSSPIRRLFI